MEETMPKQDTHETDTPSARIKKTMMNKNSMLIAGAVIFLMVGILAAVLILGNSSKSEEDQIKDDIIAFAEKYGYEDEIEDIDETYNELVATGTIDVYKDVKEEYNLDSFYEFLELNEGEESTPVQNTPSVEEGESSTNTNSIDKANRANLELSLTAYSVYDETVISGVPTCDQGYVEIGTDTGNVDLSILVEEGYLSEIPTVIDGGNEGSTGFEICYDEESYYSVNIK